jgi:hypothetical protein
MQRCSSRPTSPPSSHVSNLIGQPVGGFGCRRPFRGQANGKPACSGHAVPADGDRLNDDTDFRETSTLNLRPRRIIAFYQRRRVAGMEPSSGGTSAFDFFRTRVWAVWVEE